MKLHRAFYILIFLALIATGGFVHLEQRKQADSIDKLRRSVEQLRDEAVETASWNDFANTFRIVGEASQMRGPWAMVFGDSITAYAPLPATVCGMPLLKAGIGGNRVSNALAFAEELSGTNPVSVVIAIGINDAQARFSTQPSHIEQFDRNYQSLVDSFNSKILLAGLTKVESGKLYSGNYDAAAADKLSENIEQRAKVIKLPFVDLGDLGPPGSTTIDGVHLTEQAKAVWRDKIVAALENELGCAHYASTAR